MEDVEVDAQCGFRSGHGCTDMVFCAHQLVEKVMQHDSNVFLKAYNSVPRLAMWLVLQKYGILGVMIDLVRVLHDNMEAKVFVTGESARIQVSNGLRQRCVCWH